MYGPIFLVVTCAALLVLSGLLGLVYLLLKPEDKTRKTGQNSLANESEKSKTLNWKIWVLYLFIAFIIAFWTVWGALFFLAVVWVLRMNPKPYSPTAPLPSDMDRNSIKSTYTWLLISPVLTIPTMLIASDSLGYSTNDLVLATLIPLVFHTPLLFRLNTKNLFVYRHTQMALLLVALRAGMAALALNIDDDGWVLFILGNGSLWLFGTSWARNQVVRRECWLMESKGEKILVPESTEPEKPASSVKDKELDDMLKSLDAPGMYTARQKALHAFQTGTPELKKRAVAVLAELGEVEKF